MHVWKYIEVKNNAQLFIKKDAPSHVSTVKPLIVDPQR